MFLKAYNQNLLLELAAKLEVGLEQIELFILEMTLQSSYSKLNELTDLFSDIFSDTQLRTHIEFGISKTHKVQYFRKVEYNRTNSYYHLKLLIQSAEVRWLDTIYDGILSRILRYYKALFSKVDNLFSNSSPKQIEAYQTVIEAIRTELKRLSDINSLKQEINSEKNKLNEQYLTKIPFRSLFHITHYKNIPGILKNGLLSHTKAHSMKLTEVDISNPEINAKRRREESIYKYSIHDYAPLYINPRNPMLHSLCVKQNMRNDLIIIKVSPNILVNSNVLFTDGNAAEESSKFYNNLDDFNKLDWSCINDEYYFDYKDGKRVKCSEVLVHNSVQIPYIDEFISYDEKVITEILGLFPNHMNIKLNIDRHIFY